MKRKPAIRLFLPVAVLLFCFLMAACSKVNQANFDKIQEGMTVEEVTGILGDPTETSQIDLKVVMGGAAQWKDEKTGRKISVQFLNGKVKFKQFEDTKP